ncbi:hypothetical protein U1Q18_001133, partial [Sarracenia purpurea var. burkii]
PIVRTKMEKTSQPNRKVKLGTNPRRKVTKMLRRLVPILMRTELNRRPMLVSALLPKGRKKLRTFWELLL